VRELSGTCKGYAGRAGAGAGPGPGAGDDPLRQERRPCGRPAWGKAALCEAVAKNPRYWPSRRLAVSAPPFPPMRMPFIPNAPSQPHLQILQYCSIAVLELCSSAARQLQRDTLKRPALLLPRSKGTAPRPPSISSNQLPELRPSMGSPVAPLPCTSNRRAGYSGRFLRRRVTGRSLLLRRISC
jgi:hypothetical protein